MSPRPWRSALVLGGIRSGKSQFAENLVSDATSVRYLATGRRDPSDAEWEARIAAHRARRPAPWSTVEVGANPLALPDLLATAQAQETLLVDDLGTWVAGVTEVTAWDRAAIEGAAAGLASAVRACAARLVLVSPEVGLSVVPATEAGRAFADALGGANRLIAAECDVAVLVIAGNAVPVKGAL